MSIQPQKQYGVTPPISIAGPKEMEIVANDSLLKELHQQGVFESNDGAKLREVVLGHIHLILTDFVKMVGMRNGMSESQAAEAGAKIYTFGSYRLGVHSPGSDIDTLCVGPRHLTREDFFSLLPDILRARDDITEVSPVPDAYVPVIGMTFMGIPIDLTYARLNLASIPEDLELFNDALLKNLDDRCVRSLNGSRVTDEILRLVPSVPVFRDALRTIKLWAHRRAIYSNVMGFCGGVAWAMLVARICQLYPNLNAGGIVSRFFLIMYQWKWPQPVLLKPIEEGALNFRVWNPKLYPADKAHRMPIITPAYPSMCSTHNVSISTQKVMKEEFERAGNIVDKIICGSAEWSELFEPHDFFTKYRYYLQITASATGQDPSGQLRWAGTVESKIRQLVLKLEYDDYGLDTVHPFTKGFNHTHYCVDSAEANKVSDGEYPEEVVRRKPEDIEGIPSGCVVRTASYYIGLKIKKPPADQPGPRKLDITYPTNEFTKTVKQWDGFDETTMRIVVRYMKSGALPDSVFTQSQLEKAKEHSSQPAKATKRRQPGNAGDKVRLPLRHISTLHLSLSNECRLLYLRFYCQQ
ncbi:polymerase [Atractiella rhizophila]|nr:polymerase [Atractiella rhizophila]